MKFKYNIRLINKESTTITVVSNLALKDINKQISENVINNIPFIIIDNIAIRIQNILYIKQI